MLALVGFRPGRFFTEIVDFDGRDFERSFHCQFNDLDSDGVAFSRKLSSAFQHSLIQGFH